MRSYIFAIGQRVIYAAFQSKEKINMEKKVQKEIQKADLFNEHWIRTPFVFTMFGSNFSLLQQSVMIKVSEHLQKYVDLYFAEKRNLLDSDVKPLFTASQIKIGLPKIIIKFSELPVLKSNYSIFYKSGEKGSMTPSDMVDEILHTSACLRVSENKIRRINVFSSVDSPLQPYEMKWVNADGVQMSSPVSCGQLEIDLNPNMVAWVFDMSKGYVNHLKQIAQDAKKRATPRIYLFLMRYYNLGKRSVDVPFDELKEYLGYLEKGDAGEILSVIYPYFKDFKRRVLDAAKNDLERLSLLNKTEITFDYEPLYRNGVKTGNPEQIRLKICTTKFGAARLQHLNRVQSEQKITEKITNIFPNIDAQTLGSIISYIPYSDLSAFSVYVDKELLSVVTRHSPSDVPSYAVTVIKNWVKARLVSGNKKPTQKELPLSSDKPMNPIKQWALCQKKMCDFVGDEIARRTFAELIFESYDEKTRKLLLQTTKAAFDEIEDRYVEKFKECLTKCFGSLPLVKYRVKPAQQ